MSKDLSEKDRDLLATGIDIFSVEDDQVLSAPVEREVVNSDPTRPTGKNRFLDYIERYKTLVAKSEALLVKVDALSAGQAFTPAEDKEKQLREAVRRVFRKNTSTVTYEMYRAAMKIRDDLTSEDTRVNTGKSVFLNSQEKS